MSISAFSLIFNIIDTKSDVPAAFPFASLIMSLSIIRGAYAWTYCICLRQTITSCKLCVQKLRIITFPRYFLFSSLTGNTPSFF